MMFIDRPQVEGSLVLIEAAKSVFHVAVETETGNQNEENDDATGIVQMERELRPLWAESIPEESKLVLEGMTIPEKNLQEYKFELITTEQTYLVSLERIISNFQKNKRLSKWCSKSQWLVLFGNISDVYINSLFFLKKLNEHFSNDIMLSKMYTILKEHAEISEDDWVDYCGNITYSFKILEMLKVNGKWQEALSDVQLRNIDTDALHSGLQLPCQRVTKIVLILKEILKRIPNKGSEEYNECDDALTYLSQIAKRCDDAISPKVNETVSRSKN